MIIQNVRCDWVFLTRPNRQDKYGVCALLPKGSEQHKQVQAAVEAAIAQGIADGKFTQAQTKSAAFKRCLRDGDLEIETEGRPARYADHVFFNASNATMPGLVDQNLNPILDEDKVYSGCWFHLDVNFYPFNHPKGGRGVGAGLNNAMLVKQDERWDGRRSAEEAFAGLVKTDQSCDELM